MAGMGYAVMGTATGKGQNRAMDAAMAAMASPLLEAGAIDGARGILINITGSGNLKLLEVNEASTIIQNAAHEDCNIIFGAVHDERMGDEVKITVIATGFKQEMPERRARMLQEATMPADYEVPIRGRSIRGAEAPAMFASEEREMRQEWRQRPLEAEARPAAETSVAPELAREVAMERATDQVEADSDTAPEDEFAAEFAARAEGGANTDDGFAEAEEEQRERDPELVPVAASVFDDDFFRRSHLAPAGEQVTAGVAMAGPSHTEGSETDELDIPAFLRRSH
jgi:cell division protein FtsZ